MNDISTLGIDLGKNTSTLIGTNVFLKIGTTHYFDFNIDFNIKEKVFIHKVKQPLNKSRMDQFRISKTLKVR